MRISLCIGLLGVVLCSVPACNHGEDVEAGPAYSRLQSELTTGQSADAVLLQPDSVNVAVRQTNAGGFVLPADLVGLAVGNGQVWVADYGNQRVLRFSASAATGADADLVLGQSGFHDTYHSGMDPAETLAMMVVGLDSTGRVYTANSSSTSRVLVYEQPTSNGQPSSYELVDPPAHIQAIRSVHLGVDADNEYVAIVGSENIGFYPPGQPGAATVFTLESIPCPAMRDVGQVGATLLVACADFAHRCPELPQPLPPPDYAGPPPSTCAAVYAYRIDPMISLTQYRLPALPSGFGSDKPPAFASDWTNPTSVFGRDADDIMLVADSGHRVLMLRSVQAHLDALFDQPSSPMVGHAHGPLQPDDAANPDSGGCLWGQDDLNSTMINYPDGRPSSLGLNSPSGISVDENGDLWILDSGNHRVLKSIDTVGGDCIADNVLGQSEMFFSLPNRLESNSCQSVSDVDVGVVDLTGVEQQAAFVVDPASNRVMVFDDPLGFQGNDVPIETMGQDHPDGYAPNASSPFGGLTSRDLFSPTHLAVDPITRSQWVSDTGNDRLGRLRYSGGLFFMDAIIGAVDNISPGHWCFVYGALAAHNSAVLYVATGSKPGAAPGCADIPEANRIFAYNLPYTQIGLDNGQPDRVFGQELIANPWEAGNLPNRGLAVSANGLNDVTALAVDADGRLWVVDSGNRRVLWFDDPMNGNVVAATTADGVVGQPNMAASEPWAGLGTPNAYGFDTPSGVAVDAAGGLWVADRAAHRVLYFPTPMVPDATENMPIANAVIGQPDFTQTLPNQGGAPEANTLDTPVAVAVDATGRLLLVADSGNFRILRYYHNDAPVISGGGIYDVIEGESVTATLGVVDPDGDATEPMTIIAVTPSSASVSLDGEQLSYDAPDGSAGTNVDVEVGVTDIGPRPETGTALVTFRVFAASHCLVDDVPCDDGDACTENDTCVDLVCTGTALDCDDDNPCTDDACDSGSGCVWQNNTASCDDGDPCTTGDACAAGVCVGGANTCEEQPEEGCGCTTAPPTWTLSLAILLLARRRRRF